jgi:nitrous oxidase accessory protein NosD
MLRISGNKIGGLGFGWRSEGLGSAANGEGIDIKKGVAAAIIDHNTITDLTGLYGIGVQSSNAIVEQNTIRNIHMKGATPESSIAAIIVDAWDNKGTTIVKGNTVSVRGANGIVIRGNADRKPSFEIYDNAIAVEEPYFPIAFTSQNITNTVIRNNRMSGGRAGLWVQKACCPPANVEFHGNDVRGVSLPFLAAQDVSAGVRMHGNAFCLKGAVDAGQRTAIPQNTFSSDCGSSNVPVPPQ